MVSHGVLGGTKWISSIHSINPTFVLIIVTEARDLLEIPNSPKADPKTGLWNPCPRFRKARAARLIQTAVRVAIRSRRERGGLGGDGGGKPPGLVASWGGGVNLANLGPQVVPTFFFGKGSPTKFDCRKRLVPVF